MKAARRVHAALCLVALAFCPPLAALAQDGPIVVGERQKPPVFSLYNFYGAIDVLWRQRSDSIDPNVGPKQTFFQNHYEETLTLNSQGHIYHPNLVELNLSGTVGLTQEDTNDDGHNTFQNAFIDEYDLNATFLRKEVAPLTIYARRAQNQVNLDFGPTQDYVLSTYGAIWDIRSPTIPTRFEVFHSDQTQSGITPGFGDLEIVQDSLLWHSEARPKPGHTLTWDYTLSNVSENTANLPDNNYLLNNANLNYSIDFGLKQRSNFTSTITYYNQTGDAPIEQFTLNEFMRLYSSESFETRYQYIYAYQDFSGVTQDLNRGVIGFTHWLYDSLTTSGNLGVETIDRSDNSNSDDYFADITLDYQKIVPLGMLSSFIGYAWNQQTNSDQVSPTAVVDQRKTFVGAEPIIIAGVGIDPETIRVTDTTGAIVYRKGVDYTVDPVSNAVLINRVPGGRIPANSSVLLDYLLVPQSDNTVTTNTFFIGARYDVTEGIFKGLSVYGRYTNQDQQVDSDQAGGFTPNSFTDITYGAQYQFRGFTLGAEIQTHDSTISPFDANRYFVTYAQRFSRGTTININATYTELVYTDNDNHIDVLLATASVQQQLTRELYLSATILWQDQQDDLNGTTRGLEEQLEINWTHRQTTIYGLVRNSNLDTDTQENSFQLFEVGVRREF